MALEQNPYEALRGGEMNNFDGMKITSRPLKLKTELSRAPALGLPNLDKPLMRHIHKRTGIALGVLAPKLGPDSGHWPYFSQQLDSVALRWPSCLCVVAATTLLVNEASTLTLGQHSGVLTPNQVQSGLEVKGHHWLTGRRLIRYQAFLMDTPNITCKVCKILTQQLCFQQSREETGMETLEQTYSSKSDLLDEPLDSLEVKSFNDGCSFVEMGTQRARVCHS